MKATELIKRLQELVEKNGDLEVGFYDIEWGWTSFDDVNYETASYGDPHRFTAQ